jgi:predicted transcriptional regulator
MNPEEIRKNLHKYIDEADESSLNILREIVSNYVKKGKGHTKSIKPMTKEEYINMVKKAGAEIKIGEVFTEEEVSAHLRKKYAGKL